MRLLNYEDDGRLTITSFDDGAIPPYAILSHTWGLDAEEVTFADLVKGGNKHKPGYDKIYFCGEQARKDRLHYFWVDTCCIDKSDKAELSSAIQSMFRWYQNATKCYVYLSDVSIKKGEANSISTEFTWEPAFRLSRWFTRGWTLQELLAPSIVEFFSQEWKNLGDKTSLKLLIQKITGVPCEALDGVPLSRFSVDERLRWKGDRETKREEDAWYSLSGIFDVEIAPAYSEGAASAFARLKGEIDKLEICIQDIRSTDPRHDKQRIEDTKGGLLADSYRWVMDNTAFQQWQGEPHSRLLWVKGDPGKGKTMLLCGIVNELETLMPQSALLSYFFCQATDGRINSATAVLRGLLHMLVTQQPSLMLNIRKKHNPMGQAVFEDANAWVVLAKIFEDTLQDTNLRPTYLIIDALDECVVARPKLLQFIAKQSSASSRVKWIVSSRNWPEIGAQLERAGYKVNLSLELNAQSVAAAVDVFIQRKVDCLAHEKQYKTEVRHAVLQHLRSNANDTFLWVALVCQDLESTPKWNVVKRLALFPPGLDSLYKRMIDQISESDSVEMCQQVLASTAILYRPVSVSELAALVEQLEDLNDLESVREIVGFCGSFLTLREDTVYFVHQSAKDFLFAKAYGKAFPDGSEAVHQAIFLRSMAILSKTLHRDMYNLEALGYPIENVKLPKTDPLLVSRYPCVYWIDHLYESKALTSSVGGLQAADVVNDFLRKKYLYWLEGLSLCKSVGKGLVLMENLWSLVQEMCNHDRLAQLVQDARRFLMYHKGAIEGYPLQTYASALLFSPTGSLIRQLFQHEAPKEFTLKPGTSDSWSACLQTLEGHGGAVNSVAFSHNSTRLASASRDRTVKIWDASSGADRTVKIWDASSGACLQTLEGHSNSVSSADLVSILALPHSDEIVTKPQQSVCQEVLISLNNTWVSHGAQKLLWLPTEYRPVCSAVSGRCVGIGTGSGKVWFCCFLRSIT
ncbi:HET-domain-containing protein [Setomelanomma holmii]|uniref:HET-domain-containing protein n=1 Tax=Setomelanomma holmii TaxID=210430 RepID=A0A9P4HEA8_9PLEO|nr:HET-domain-containing protein [Setomelanomma holmii]